MAKDFTANKAASWINQEFNKSISSKEEIKDRIKSVKDELELFKKYDMYKNLPVSMMAHEALINMLEEELVK